jgi:hypothetical protein
LIVHANLHDTKNLAGFLSRVRLEESGGKSDWFFPVSIDRASVGGWNFDLFACWLLLASIGFGQWTKILLARLEAERARTTIPLEDTCTWSRM